MAKYKIDNTTILTDSGGRTLVSNDITASGTITVTNTIKTLSPTYFTDIFQLHQFKDLQVDIVLEDNSRPTKLILLKNFLLVLMVIQLTLEI